MKYALNEKFYIGNVEKTRMAIVSLDSVNDDKLFLVENEDAIILSSIKDILPAQENEILAFLETNFDFEGMELSVYLSKYLKKLVEKNILELK